MDYRGLRISPQARRTEGDNAKRRQLADRAPQSRQWSRHTKARSMFAASTVLLTPKPTRRNEGQC